jgi:peptidoglycan/xylan/chitin deacetylase (PgdA/CDA1 family)
MYDVVAPILRARGVPAVFFLTASVLDNRELVYTQKISLLVHACLRREAERRSNEVRQLLKTEGIQGPDIAWCLRSIGYQQRHMLDRIAMILGVDFAEYTSSRRPYLTSDQVRGLMAQGFAIGSHSLDHPLFAELNIDEQLRQTWDSISWLSNRFQYECQAFAFPFRDTHVSLEFFQKAFSRGAVKVSFGTGGLYRHFFPRNLTRFTMEDGDRSASEIVAREFFVTRTRRPHWAFA